MSTTTMTAATMKSTRLRRRRTLQVATLAVIALLLGLIAVTNRPANAAAGPSVLHSRHQHGQPGALRTSAQVAFHDQMRKLWEDHVTWTRLAIVTFADRSPGFDATASRLLANQVDIGAAIKPFYGHAAGDRLTALLHEHITIAVELMSAARAANTPAFDAANARWKANANAIADLLASANPRSWPRDVLRADMATHLDQTLAEAAHELQGDYAASVTDYEAVHQHILAMADLLSAGIMAQFPARFR